MSLRRKPLELEVLDRRDLMAVNPLDTSALGSGPVEAAEVRVLQEVRDVGVVQGQLLEAQSGANAGVLAAAQARLAVLEAKLAPSLRQVAGADRVLPEWSMVTLAGTTARVVTGTDSQSVVQGGEVLAVGDLSRGTPETPTVVKARDDLHLFFTVPISGVTGVWVRPLNGGTVSGQLALNDGTRRYVPFTTDGTTPIALPAGSSFTEIGVTSSSAPFAYRGLVVAGTLTMAEQAERVSLQAQVGQWQTSVSTLRSRAREELSEVVFGAAQLGVSVPGAVSSGQELVSVTPTAQAWAPNSVELAFRFTELAGSYDLLQNGSVKVRFNPGTSTLTIPYDGSASLGNWSLRSVATGVTTSLDLLVTRGVQSGVFSFLKQSTNQAYGTQSLTNLTGLVTRPVLTSERLNAGGVSPTTQAAINALLGGDLSWLQNVPLTASELSGARDRLSVGTLQDETTLRTALLTRPGVEAVLTPSLSFQTGWNLTGQHTLTVSGSDLPEGSRVVLASDAGLTQVLDERSVLAGSDSVTMLRGNATFVGLVDASGQVLGKPFTLANENGSLMVRQAGVLVGQPNTTLPATALAGVLTPVTKDSLQSVTPSVRFVTSGSSVDLRYEWLPVGAVITLTNPIDGTVSAPVTVTSRTGNLPLYLPANQGRILHVKASDGRQLFRPMGVARRGDTGQMSFYEVEPPWNRWVEVLELTSERTLATREEARGVEAGRSTLLPRLNAVSISADTTSRRNWGAALGELAGIGLSLSEREIARRHLPTLIGTNVTEDSALVLAEIDRLTALPGSNSRGWNERFVLSQVSDAYARAREDIKTAWPIFCEMIVAGFQVVQSQRTDVANVTPVSAVEQTRNFYAQSAQVLHLLPSAQTILSCLNQHFDRCHAFLSGAASTWQQEVDAASQAGSITRDPNPGLRGTETPQQRAYDAAASALGDAERLYRQAVSTGVARYISAATVTLERARVTLQQAELALKGANTASTPAQLTKQTLENGDIVTVMNKTSLQYILAGLPQKIASAQARLQVVTSATVRLRIQQELTHWQMLKVATEGLLSLIPAGQTLPNLSTSVARGWTRYIERTTTDPQAGGLVLGESATFVSDTSLTFGTQSDQPNPSRWVFSNATPALAAQGQKAELSGRIPVGSGVSYVPLEVKTNQPQYLVLSSANVLNGLTLTIRDGTGATVATLTKTGLAAQAVLRLTLQPGDYVASVSGQLRALTQSETFQELGQATSPVNNNSTAIAYSIKLLPEVVINGSPTKIEGHLSLPGSGRATEVHLAVAEFYADGGERKTNHSATSGLDRIAPLDPTRPVWVVIHGMVSTEEKPQIEAVARELYRSGMQVVTLDWRAAAQWQNVHTDDAPWTPLVGEWAANRLLALGFAPELINIAGHSHGTYAAYHLAKRVMDARGGAQINALVALDPAGNREEVSGYDSAQINFRAVSRTSLALEGSYIMGSDELAATADVTFRVDSPSTMNPVTEHSLPVSLFAELLALNRRDPSQLVPRLRLANLMVPEEQRTDLLETDVFAGEYEGVITVEPVWDAGGGYYIADPRSLRYRRSGSVNDTIDTILPPTWIQ